MHTNVNNQSRCVSKLETESRHAGEGVIFDKSTADLNNIRLHYKLNFYQ